ncbi:MAG: alpha-amylase family glycosyl hydrolase [Agromyces sp.]
MTISDARDWLASTLDATNRGDADLLDRFDRWAPDLWAGLAAVYPLEQVVEPLLHILVGAHRQRDEALRQRDRERVLEPDWFQRHDTLGYVAYTDLFNGNLRGLNERIDYLERLGVSYLHLMPILRPRPGANDGGYAVMDYRALREDLGTMAELRESADQLHSAGISLTLDLVLNHVALEHEWAAKARAGDPEYREYFYVYPDRTVPDQFERTLPEVFPDFAPGNFTFNEELNGWVWTTFNDYQWDVNWSNPKVFCEYADIIANLANHGVDCLRLDAIAFIWKRLGTSCQNEAEVHDLTQALRSFSRILAPALVFKAEAIVGPAQVGAYLGEGAHAGKVSDLAYHNSFMVQIWAAIAAKDARLMAHTMARFQALPTTTAWGVYLRCHDDIGWAIDDADANAVGWNGHLHRMFLADYFTGKHPGSDASGVDFQMDPASGERRTSGTAASLAGIEAALKSKDEIHLRIAIDRYLCAYALVFGFGGIPLLYMGDEIGLLNDRSYLRDPAKAEDSRWIHRPAMPWPAALAAEKQSGRNLEKHAAAEIRQGIQRLIAARKRLPALHASVSPTIRLGRGQGVVIIERHHPAGLLVQVANLSDQPRTLSVDELNPLEGSVVDELTGAEYQLSNTLLQPYEVRWLRANDR